MLSWGTDRTLQKYGLKVTMGRTVVEGRVLVAPKVQYGTGVATPGTSGRWDLKGKKFLHPNPAPLRSWSVTVISGKRGGKPDKSTIEHFVKEFVKVYKSHGGRVENANPGLNLGTGDDTGAIVTAAWNMAGNQSNSRPQILVFILPDKDSVIYGRIKRSAECRYGVVRDNPKTFKTKFRADTFFLGLSMHAVRPCTEVPGPVHFERLHEVQLEAWRYYMPRCWTEVWWPYWSLRHSDHGYRCGRLPCSSWTADGIDGGDDHFNGRSRRSVRCGL